MKVLGILLVLAGTVCADPIAFRFTGRIGSVVDSGNALAGGIAAGDPFTVDVIYDGANPGGPLTEDASHRRRQYSFSNPASNAVGPKYGTPYLLIVQVGEFAFSARLGVADPRRFQIEVIDNYSTRDILNFGSSEFGMDFLGSGTYRDRGMGIQFVGASAQTLESVELPIQINFEEWDGAALNIFANDSALGRLRISGAVDAVDPVPEPGTFVLFGAAALGAYVYRRRRRAS